MHVSGSAPRVLVTGATGFVGSHLYPALRRHGWQPVGATRDVARARVAHPDWTLVACDLQDPASVRAALDGCSAAVYLVHGMGDGDDYEAAERRAAETFRDAASAAGLQRIVYLGGMRPSGVPSRHLRSRLATGEVLRAGPVPAVELQATMIIGCGSESFRMVRDLAARLPAMLLPRWLRSRTQPIGIADVVVALRHALRLPLTASAVYALPGPETMTARTILRRTAALLGRRPWTLDVPVVTPLLSSYWIRLVTRSDPRVATELVDGLRTDILSPDEGFWRFLPAHHRQAFDEAARLALAGEAEELSAVAQWVEDIAERVTPTAGHGLAS